MAARVSSSEDSLLIKQPVALTNYLGFELSSSDGKQIDDREVAQCVSAIAASDAGANDIAARIIEKKRTLLVEIHTEAIWRSGTSRIRISIPA